MASTRENESDTIHYREPEVLPYSPDAAAPPEYTSTNDPPPSYATPSVYPPPYWQHQPQGIRNEVCSPEEQPYCYPQPGQDEFPKPGFIYPGAQAINFQCPLPQQQQQRVVIVDGQDDPGRGSPSVSMTDAIVLACLVTWLCASKCGVWAFRLAWTGRRMAAAGETLLAIRLRQQSIGCSIVGIIFGIIVIIILVCILTTSKSSPTKTTLRPPVTFKLNLDYHTCYDRTYGLYYPC